MLGEVRLVVVLLEGPAAKYEVVGDWLCAVLRDQLLLPVVAWLLQPVTIPSNVSTQMVPRTVNASTSVDVDRSGLVATTLHAPAAAPVRENWQRITEPTAVTDVAGISACPALVSLNVVDVEMPVPETSTATLEFANPLAGLMPVNTGGGIAATIVPLRKYWPMLPYTV